MNKDARIVATINFDHASGGKMTTAYLLLLLRSIVFPQPSATHISRQQWCFQQRRPEGHEDAD